MCCSVLLSSKFIQDKYNGYSQKEAAYIAGAVYDSSLVLSAIVGILIVSTKISFCQAAVRIVTLMTCLLQDYVGLRGIFALACAVLTLPVFGLLAFSYVPPLVSTIWLGVTYSFAAVSLLTVNV